MIRLFLIMARANQEFNGKIKKQGLNPCFWFFNYLTVLYWLGDQAGAQGIKISISPCQ